MRKCEEITMTSLNGLHFKRKVLFLGIWNHLSLRSITSAIRLNWEDSFREVTVLYEIFILM